MMVQEVSVKIRVWISVHEPLCVQMVQITPQLAEQKRETTGWQLGMNTTRGCREELGLWQGALPMQKHVQSMRSAMDLSLYGVSVSLDGLY